jgi:hypothetical protein
VPINFTVRRVGFAFVRKFRFTALVLVGNKKRHALNGSCTPDCWDGKALELSYDNLEEEGLNF